MNTILERVKAGAATALEVATQILKEDFCAAFGHDWQRGVHLNKVTGRIEQRLVCRRCGAT